MSLECAHGPGYRNISSESTEENGKISARRGRFASAVVALTLGLLAVGGIAAIVVAASGSSDVHKQDFASAALPNPSTGPAGFHHAGAFAHILPPADTADAGLEGKVFFHPNAHEALRNSEHRHHKEMAEHFSGLYSVSTIMNDAGEVIPDMKDKNTILALAYMSSDAYVDPISDTAHWPDVDGYDRSESYGWDQERFGGFRGHLFRGKGTDSATGAERDLLVMTIRGTALSPTALKFSERDRIMDNKMFGCCCGDDVWNHGNLACNCIKPKTQFSRLAGSSLCDKECMTAHTKDDPCTGYREPTKECLTPPYIQSAIATYKRIREENPDAHIWVTGHSLGGALSSLLAAQVSIPAVAFEAPGERFYANWLGMDIEKPYDNIFHITNDGDPIPVGRCSGAWSTCSMAGYALETRCHLGHSCEYKGAWVQAVERYHGIDSVIDVFVKKMDPPECKPHDPFCVDCTGYVYE